MDLVTKLSTVEEEKDIDCEKRQAGEAGIPSREFGLAKGDLGISPRGRLWGRNSGGGTGTTRR